MLMMLPPSAIEMLECLLSGEKHSENVCIKHFVELLLGDFFEWHEFVNAGVVDHDVDLAECFLRFSEQSLDVCLLRDAALDRDSFSAALTNFIYHAICVLLGRRIIDDHSRTLGCEFFCNPCADSLRRSRYHCNFSV